ncbi:TetR/AcrR family transcriptional regulator [Saccharopolyspora rhizosphaerae]|uniref:TetR/AcrR family transcriptional regulator n=1 Tax=Saccharopolyspora rhizosphaerae TaxID=2492662 RepID=A0A3R8Q7B0_9PSEU|nr:TetR/AcrR family transcriptional regulator [Saccharopolyspora rhizosphaerae]RRO14741.1 TetR/AcrR family transcriptional regulator [Saccharopolyspora rhizosphaerae]
MTASTTGQVDGRSARWAGYREKRREELVDAALRAIAEHGPDVSVEQMAEEAGVARPRLYKYFTDTADLGAAIAARAAEMVTDELAPMFNPHGTPNEMIRAAIGAHTNWLAEHGNLYRYLSRNSATGQAGQNVITDVKTVIARQVTGLFQHFLDQFGVQVPIVQPLAFGIVGLVESGASSWMEEPDGITLEELTDWLCDWTWHLLDQSLQVYGIELDPDVPLVEADPAD